MGTSKPLTIYVHPDYWETQWVKALQAKGHIVMSDIGLWQADLILGPTCARFVPGMEEFLTSFLAGARKIKYSEKK